MDFNGEEIELVESDSRLLQSISTEAVPAYILHARSRAGETPIDSDDEDDDETPSHSQSHTHSQRSRGQAYTQAHARSRPPTHSPHSSQKHSTRSQSHSQGHTYANANARPVHTFVRQTTKESNDARTQLSTSTPLSSELYEDETIENSDEEEPSLFERIDKKYGHMVNLETMVADTEDMPVTCKWLTFCLYTIALCTIGGVAFFNNYTLGRTQTFITLDKFSGVCKDDPELNTCCEVAASITGTYLADSTGYWNTQRAFEYVNQIYAVSLTGLSYTSIQWREIMEGIRQRLFDVAVQRGTFRDFAWNLVAWASFTAISNTNGFLHFYSSANMDIIFDKPSYHQGYASAQSDNATCRLRTVATVVGGTIFTVAQDLNISFSGQRDRYACTEEPTFAGQTSIECSNPCPNIFPGPKVMGYDSSRATATYFTWSVDMQSVMTALAINMRITPLANLEKYPNDVNRRKLLKDMITAGSINTTTAGKVSSYFELLFSPTPPIYCADYLGDGSKVSCLVRVGNLLVYPILSSFGFPQILDDSPPPSNETSSNSTQRRILYSEDDIDEELFSGENKLLFKLGERERHTSLRDKARKSSKGNEGQQDAHISPLATSDAPSEAPTQSPTLSPTNPPSLSPTTTPPKPPQLVLRQCVLEVLDKGPNIRSACDLFDIVLGLVYFPTDGEIDNGKIFKFAEHMANRVAADPVWGDLYPQTAGYNALISSLYRTSKLVVDKKRTFTDVFSQLCDGELSDCAMFSADFFGGSDKTLSIYEFQPENSLAFSNTLYDESTMWQIVRNPPTQLTQSYYSCVQTEWTAAYNALGLALSNSTLAVSLGLIAYMFISMAFLSKWLPFRGEYEDADNLRWKREKTKEALFKEEHFENFIFALHEDIKKGRMGAPKAAMTSIRRFEREHESLNKARTERLKRALKRRKTERLKHSASQNGLGVVDNQRSLAV